MKNKIKGFTLRSSALAFALLIVMNTLWQPSGTEAKTGEALLAGPASIGYFSDRALEETFGSSFYREYCAGFGDMYQRIFEAVTFGKVRKVVLCLDMSEASSAYNTELPASSPTGVEKIGEMAKYRSIYGSAFVKINGSVRLDKAQESLKVLGEAAGLCRKKGADLTVMITPLHRSRLEALSSEDVIAYKKGLAEICSFIDFSVSDISSDMRYFSSRDIPRPSVCDMMLSFIRGDKKDYMPASFGVRMSRYNAERKALRLSKYELPEDDGAYTAEVPVLLYHNITDKPHTRAEVTPESFRRNMEWIKREGYNAVSAKQMTDFVKEGKPLPPKPILITLDDGYLSNYEIAYPILKELGLRAVIFPIGSSIGSTTYKDTGIKITPHFTKAQAKQMELSGVIEIQSHTYDMHMWGPFEKGPVRDTADILKGETKEQYVKALVNDFEMYRKVWDEDFYALAYPKGRYNETAEKVFHGLGIDMTFSTTTDMKNVLIKGQPQSLYALCRYDVADGTTDAQMMKMLSSYGK